MVLQNVPSESKIAFGCSCEWAHADVHILRVGTSGNGGGEPDQTWASVSMADPAYACMWSSAAAITANMKSQVISRPRVIMHSGLQIRGARRHATAIRELTRALDRGGSCISWLEIDPYRDIPAGSPSEHRVSIFRSAATARIHATLHATLLC